MTEGYSRKFNDLSGTDLFASPTFGAKQSGIVSSFIKGNTQATTHMGMLSNKSFSAKPINTGNLKAGLKDSPSSLQQARTATAAARSDCNAKRADLGNTMQQAKSECIEKCKEVAAENGINYKSFVPIPSEGATFITASTTALRLGPVADGVSVINNIIQQSKKLSPSERKARMQEVHNKLCSGQSQQQQRAHSYTRLTSNAADDGGKGNQSKFSWENMTPEQMEEFLGCKMEDQPECKALDNILFKLDKVDANNDFVAASINSTPTATKIAEAYERGDSGTIRELTANAACMHSASLNEISGAACGAGCAAELGDNIRGLSDNPTKLEIAAPQAAPQVNVAGVV